MHTDKGACLLDLRFLLKFTSLQESTHRTRGETSCGATLALNPGGWEVKELGGLRWELGLDTEHLAYVHQPQRVSTAANWPRPQLCHPQRASECGLMLSQLD